MSRTGKCTNYAGCLLAYRIESITLAGDAPFICPECKQPLIEGGCAPGRKPRAIPAIILGGISLLVIMSAGAVFYQARNLGRQPRQPGRIGSSFEQAELAAAHGEFMPSRHMTNLAPTPSASPAKSPPRATPGAR